MDHHEANKVGFCKSQVRAFFDAQAPQWDGDMVRDQRIIDCILDAAGVKPGVRVLDVGCGTGVLFPDYLARQVSAITGVDISPAMIQVAKSKFHDDRITLLCADIEEVSFADPFHCCVVYNAFPHFPDPDRLIAHLATTLVAGGRLTVAHGMSREQIDHHHSGSARGVSAGLMSENDLSQRFAPYFHVDVKVSDTEKYIVSGVKRD